MGRFFLTGKNMPVVLLHSIQSYLGKPEPLDILILRVRSIRGYGWWDLECKRVAENLVWIQEPQHVILGFYATAHSLLHLYKRISTRWKYSSKSVLLVDGLKELGQKRCEYWSHQQHVWVQKVIKEHGIPRPPKWLLQMCKKIEVKNRRPK